MRRVVVIAALLMVPSLIVAQQGSTDGPEFDMSRWRQVGTTRAVSSRAGGAQLLLANPVRSRPDAPDSACGTRKGWQDV